MLELDAGVLPVGVTDFAQIRREQFYYVDKTDLIGEILEHQVYVSMIMRPRGFGKTVNMSMLRYFLEIGTDPTLFDGLHIKEETALCERYMGRFPVVSIDLGEVDGETYEEAYRALARVIGREVQRHSSLEQSTVLYDYDLEILHRLGELSSDGSMDNDAILASSIHTLTELLQRHYGEAVVVLIDDYDVPLDRALRHGYYDKMSYLIRRMFGYALKTNQSLKFAVLTGCLPMERGDEFNNVATYSIVNAGYAEYYGFTEDEVRHILRQYHLEDHAQIIRDWCGGYQVGGMILYRSCDVINYICEHVDSVNQVQNENRAADSDELIQRLFNAPSRTTQYEIDQLVAGRSLTMQIRQHITCNDVDRYIGYLWNALYLAGYLTSGSRRYDGMLDVHIPNCRVRDIYASRITW